MQTGTAKEKINDEKSRNMKVKYVLDKKRPILTATYFRVGSEDLLQLYLHEVVIRINMLLDQTLDFQKRRQ